MRLPVTVGVRGQYRITELHPDTLKPITGRGGVPIVRDAAGNPRPVGGWRPNMITDLGLDTFGAESGPLLMGYADGSAGPSHCRRYLLVGSDATPEQASDTALGALLGTSNSAAGFDPEFNNTSDDGAGNAVTDVQIARVYTADGDQVVRELGFSSTPSTPPAYFRWIPKDESNDPVSISLLNGRKLRVDHALSLVMPSQLIGQQVDIEEFDVGGNSVTTRSYTANLYAYIQNTEGIVGAQRLNNMTAWSTVYNTRPAATVGGGFQVPSAGRAAGSSVPLSAYTPGSFAQSAGGRLSESGGNNDPLNSFAVGYLVGSSSMFWGYIVALQDGPHPKDDLHTLAVLLDWTWVRA